MRVLFDQDHEDFRRSVRQFIDREMRPHFQRWEDQGHVDPELFVAAGRAGILGMSIPTVHGGAGIDDFRFSVVFNEEIHAAQMTGSGLGILTHTDIVLPYLLKYASEEQSGRWLPSVAAGETILAIAMTEPGTGSDLRSIQTTAVRDGDGFRLNGTKMFITNGSQANLFVVFTRVSESEGDGMALLLVEADRPGVGRGRPMKKLGLRSEDIAEITFQDVLVPSGQLLGEVGRAFAYLTMNLPQERLSIAVSAVASARAALESTIDYCRSRHAFGAPISQLQNTKFQLAEVATEVELGQSFVDRCVLELNGGSLTAESASMAKWWCTEMLNRTVSTCLQLHGGYGYMQEYAISRAFVDARVTTIYGGTTEIMKEIIGRSILH